MNCEAPPDEKVGFSDMARRIGAKWKAISAEDKAHFEALAAKDRWRYNVEMGEWAKRKMARKKEVEAAVVSPPSSQELSEESADAAPFQKKDGLKGLDAPSVHSVHSVHSVPDSPCSHERQNDVEKQMQPLPLDFDEDEDSLIGTFSHPVSTAFR